jgi:hypothetical protein
LDLGIEGALPPVPNAAVGLLIDDFDVERAVPVCIRSAPSSAAPLHNLLGYCSECFNDCARGNGGQLDARITNDPELSLRCAGGALAFDFNVSQGQQACDPPSGPALRYAGYVELLVGNDLCKEDRGPFNLEALRAEFLAFFVKAAAGSEKWVLEVALKDVVDGQSDKVLVSKDTYVTPDEYAGGWRQVRIPLRDLTRGNPAPDFKRLREINFTVASPTTGVTAGKLYIDEIAFVR